MKYLIKTIMIIVPVLGIFYLLGCTKVNDANEKFPQIVPDFTSKLDTATGTVTFVSTSKYGNNYFWNFGDSITSTQENPVHTYARNGNYSVTLQVSNAAGAVASITKTVDVVIIMPIVLMPVSLPITFDAVTVDYANNFITTSLPVTLITNPQLSGSNTAATKVARIVNAGVAGENFGVKLNPGVDITTQKSFTVQIYSTVAIPVGIQLSGGATPNPQNTQAHGGTGWEKLTFTVGGTGTYTNLFLYFGAGTTAGTFYIDDIIQIPTVAPTSPTTNAPVPTRSQANVISIYSDTYTTVPGRNLNPNWGQTTAQSQITIGTNNILKYASFNYQGTEFTSQNLTGYDSVHIDVWTPNATDLKFTPIGGGETLVGLTPLNIGQWNSYDLPLTAFTAVNFASVAQIKFDGQGGVTPSTVFVDNIYFYKGAVTTPPFNGGLIINGDFEASTSAPWTEGVGTTLAPVVSMSGNKYYSKNVTTAGQPFDVNLSQKGLNIVSGSTYKLTFDAWSSVNRPIVAGIGLSGGSFANTTQTVNITTTRTTYTLATLTATGWGDPDSRAIFDIGAATGVVNIDNVSLVLVPPTGGGCSGTPIPAATFPVDFEACSSFTSSFGAGITVDLAANPSATGINTSSYVLKVEKPAGSDFYAGLQNTFASNFDFAKTFSMQVYSTKAPVTFRFEAATDPSNPASGNPAPVFVTITTANTWVPVSFQFTGIPPNNVGCNQLVIKPDNAVGDPPITVSGTYYIDNVNLQ